MSHCILECMPPHTNAIPARSGDSHFTHKFRALGRGRLGRVTVQLGRGEDVQPQP